MPNYERNEVIEDYIKKELENVHTILVGKVTAVKSTTIDVQPVTKKVLNGCIIDMPLFSDVPPVYPYGGASYDAMPITAGDYCLLFVSELSTERWYAGEDNIEPNEDRRFDYSDCFAMVGVLPQSKAIPIPSVATMQGDRIIDGDHTHTGTTTQTGDIVLNGVSLKDFIEQHTHGGVSPGGSNTNAPNPL